MAPRTPNFAAVLGTVALSSVEIDGVLAIGFAMANANGHASYDELDAFRALATHLKPGAKVAALFDSLTAELEEAGAVPDFVRTAAKTLERSEAQDAAYKAAYALAVIDLETNEEERDLDDLLIEVLKLDGRVDALEQAVNEALMG